MIDQSAEIELLKQKLMEKDDLLRGLMKTETHLVPLPNGDLHRGFRKTAPATANIDVEVIPDNMGNPLDRAISNILKAANGGHALTCIWCGLQWSQTDIKAVREHLKESHPTVVTGWENMNSEILMANLAEANQRLEAANTTA